MSLSAEERATKIAFYENVADNENATPELRKLFARKANWLRILARLQEKGPQTDPTPSGSLTDREALLFSPTRLSAWRIKQWRIANTRQQTMSVTKPLTSVRDQS